MAKKNEGWAGYTTEGVSGYHFTGHDDQCKMVYDTFTCTSDYHKENQ